MVTSSSEWPEVVGRPRQKVVVVKTGPRAKPRNGQLTTWWGFSATVGSGQQVVTTPEFRLHALQ